MQSPSFDVLECFAVNRACDTARRVPHDRRDESIPEAYDGFDVLPGRRRIVECAAQLRDVDGQDPGFDAGVRPDARQELAFVDESPSVAREHDEHVEGHRRQGHRGAIAGQTAIGEVECEIPERIPLSARSHEGRC